eukprot:753290-Hanusia_phi.AAC.7
MGSKLTKEIQGKGVREACCALGADLACRCQLKTAEKIEPTYVAVGEAQVSQPLTFREDVGKDLQVSELVR